MHLSAHHLDLAADELNKKHREEKKNTDIDIDLSVVDPDAVEGLFHQLYF